MFIDSILPRFNRSQQDVEAMVRLRCWLGIS